MWIVVRSKDRMIGRHELRSYTDSCAHGTLDDVIRKHGSVHESEAIYNLHTGLNFINGSAEQAPDEGWNVILHRDIKPENILLKEPADPYASFPTPVLADLDGLIELGEESDLEGKYEVSSYPQGYAAPASHPVELSASL